eukprot:9209708-Lingulodinium_polyedra.AAC.1
MPAHTGLSRTGARPPKRRPHRSGWAGNATPRAWPPGGTPPAPEDHERRAPKGRVLPGADARLGDRKGTPPAPEVQGARTRSRPQRVDSRRDGDPRAVNPRPRGAWGYAQSRRG